MPGPSPRAFTRHALGRGWIAGPPSQPRSHRWGVRWGKTKGAHNRSRGRGRSRPETPSLADPPPKRGSAPPAPSTPPEDGTPSGATDPGEPKLDVDRSGSADRVAPNRLPGSVPTFPEGRPVRSDVPPARAEPGGGARRPISRLPRGTACAVPVASSTDTLAPHRLLVKYVRPQRLRLVVRTHRRRGEPARGVEPTARAVQRPAPGPSRRRSRAAPVRDRALA